MRAHLLKTAIVWTAFATSSPLLMSTAHAQAARYELDPDHTTVAFLVDHIGYAKVLGLFRSARGSYRFDEATWVNFKLFGLMGLTLAFVHGAHDILGTLLQAFDDLANLLHRLHLDAVLHLRPESPVVYTDHDHTHDPATEHPHGREHRQPPAGKAGRSARGCLHAGCGQTRADGQGALAKGCPDAGAHQRLVCRIPA